MNKDEYLSYLDRIKELFIEDVNFNRYLQDLNSGKSSFQINQKYLRKVFDHDWIDIIEEILPSLDAIVRNPRRFITVEEDIIDISLAKQISVESVKHLAQHTQFISSANPKTGTVTTNVKQAVLDAKAGRVEYRTDSYGNIHGIIGKVSFSEEDLMANLNAFVKNIIR